jgi:rfaE bifunctional protein kinase chain/domain
MTRVELEQLFQKFNGLKVLIVGDVMVDKYIIGRVERMSPEAPVPVVDASGFDARLGGAGNVALNIRAMGGIPVLCTVIGADEEGKDLEEILHAQGLTLRALVKSEKRKTTTKTRVIGNGKHIVRIDHEITADLDTMDTFLLEDHFKREIENADVVIMEDYNKGVLHALNISKLINMAREKNVPVVVDPKKANFTAYKGATLFKPNLKEIKEGLNIQEDLKQINNLRNAVNMLEVTLQNEISMVTLSEQGVYIKSGAIEHHIPAHLRNIADVSGAGDTVISIAAMALALNCPLNVLAELSNLAGGLVCEESGVVPVDKEKLLDEALKVMC